MYKFLLTLILLSITCRVQSNDLKFEIYRSAKIEMNKESHDQSDFSAFHSLEQMNKESDLDEEPKDKKTDEAETHPIDFSKINLNNFNLISKNERREMMQNDESNEFNDAKIKSKKYQMRTRKHSIESNQVLNYDYYCSLNKYLAECLRKKLSTKFLLRFKSKDYKSNLTLVIDDLNNLKSFLENSIKPLDKSSLNISNLKSILTALDETFYNSKALEQISSKCVLDHQRDCKKNSQT